MRKALLLITIFTDGQRLPSERCYCISSVAFAQLALTGDFIQHLFNQIMPRLRSVLFVCLFVMFFSLPHSSFAPRVSAFTCSTEMESIPSNQKKKKITDKTISRRRANQKPFPRQPLSNQRCHRQCFVSAATSVSLDHLYISEFIPSVSSGAGWGGAVLQPAL